MVKIKAHLPPMRLSSSLIIAMPFVLTGGCMSQIAPMPETLDSWIGTSKAKYQEIYERGGTYADRIGWEPLTYDLLNGDHILVRPIRRDCYVHWVLDKHETIVGYRMVGKNCF